MCILKVLMKILKVVGNIANKRVIEVKVAGAVKASNQGNPTSVGTTFIQVDKRSPEYELIGVLTFRRSEEGKKIRKASMKRGIDYTPFRAKQMFIRVDGKMNCLAGVPTRDNLVLLRKA